MFGIPNCGMRRTGIAAIDGLIALPGGKQPPGSVHWIRFKHYAGHLVGKMPERYRTQAIAIDSGI